MKDISVLKQAGIDVDAALTNLGDIGMYNDLLKEFFDGLVNQMNEIKRVYLAKDFENYKILVHALKSNCRTFGINSLATLAYNHEMNSTDVNYVNQNINSLFTKVNEVYGIINNYLN